jgi:D-beta-D-heptose 7-phosphate kinase/D-beta-D-heptose 1-phosphate adenosyltransferase
MLTDLADSLGVHVTNFRMRRVVVLGDAILDEYLLGDCSRISPEAPVPVLRVSSTRRVLGGAANTAANVASLGGHATLIALVGSDDAGATLERCATNAGIDLRPVKHSLATLRKTRVVGQQQQIVRLDYEEPQTPGDEVEAEILRMFDASLEQCDIVVISDYAKGFLTPRLCPTIIRRAHDAGIPVIVDPRPQHREYYRGCDYLTPNWRESRALLRLPDAEPTPEAITATARSLASEMDTNIVLTLGAHGITFYSRKGDEHFTMPTDAREVFDVSGAGDTVVAALALARASGADHAASIALANRAASVVVAKFGTATVTPEEMFQGDETHRLVPRHLLAPLAAALRSKGKRIVTINGSFDILHNGHLYILNEARKRGDVLIVGLNSDASVRSYKGPDRPIVPERHRAEMLLALRMVDYVHIFDELDPIAFLKELRPDVHVNGSEYGSNCIESEIVKEGGGKIHIVDRIPGFSTTRLADLQNSTRAVTSS